MSNAEWRTIKYQAVCNRDSRRRVEMVMVGSSGTSLDKDDLDELREMAKNTIEKCDGCTGGCQIKALSQSSRADLRQWFDMQPKSLQAGN